jgi:hypothetical protein
VDWVGEAFGGQRRGGRTRGLGMLFVHPADRPQAAEIIERELRRPAPAHRLAHRADRSGGGLRAQRDTTPKVLQLVVGFDEGGAVATPRCIARASGSNASPDRGCG